MGLDGVQYTACCLEKAHLTHSGLLSKPNNITVSIFNLCNQHTPPTSLTSWTISAPTSVIA
jgi:hypothetical protein